jgi:hypothetical protein
MARCNQGTRTVISPKFLLLDLLYELAYYKLLLLLLRHSSDSGRNRCARQGSRPDVWLRFAESTIYGLEIRAIVSIEAFCFCERCRVWREREGERGFGLATL